MNENEKIDYLESDDFVSAMHRAMKAEITLRSGEIFSKKMIAAYKESKERIESAPEENKKQRLLHSALETFMAAPENTEASRLALGDILEIEDIDAVTEKCQALKAGMGLRFGTIQNAFIDNRLSKETLLQHCGSLALFTSNLNVFLKTEEKVKNELNFL